MARRRLIKNPILTMIPILALSLALGACSAETVHTQASQAQSQGSDVLSVIYQEAEKIGQQSKEVADSITESVQDFLVEVRQSLSIESEDFEKAWEKTKEKLTEMKKAAISQERQFRIQNTTEQLEAKYKETMEKLRDNPNIQAAKTAVSKFWAQVQSGMDDLTE